MECVWIFKFKNCYKNSELINYISLIVAFFLLVFSIILVIYKIYKKNWNNKGYYENNFLGIISCNIFNIIYLLSIKLYNIKILNFLTYDIVYFCLFFMISLDFNILAKLKNKQNNLLVKYNIYLFTIYHIIFILPCCILVSVEIYSNLFLGLYFIFWSIKWIFYGINYYIYEQYINLDESLLNMKHIKSIPTIETALIYRNKWSCYIGFILWLYNGIFILINPIYYNENMINNIFNTIYMHFLAPSLACFSIIAYYLYQNYGNNPISFVFIPRNLNYNK